MGKKFGLTHGLIADSNDLNNKIYNIIGSKGADISIETTGIPKVIEQAYELTASDGKTILVGVPNDKISIYSLPLHFEKILTGSHGGDAIPNIDIPRYIRLINQKKMTLENIITHEFNLKEINSAIDLLRSGKAGRIIIKMNG
jgi:S-(hydroxymethyl)glutathione dehydrogenase/alcohol dehydrogenase